MTGSPVSQAELIPTVGVIGGGQLAWMMAQVAPEVGVKLAVQTPNLTDPAVSLTQAVVQAAVADAKGTAQLARQSDVITFENEFVDLDALEVLAARGVTIYPRLQTLRPLLDKWEQRRFLQNLGLPVPRFLTYAPGFPAPLPFPCVLKARRHGYDGQGTQILQTTNELPPTGEPDTWMLEAFVPYEKELAIIGARNAAGDIRLYPVVETIQRQQICHCVIAPAALGTEIIETIGDYCRQILTGLDYVGVLGIELFLLHQSAEQTSPAQRLLINELAPRTHNSGHYSLDACVTSQFALQLQAVTGKPLGKTELTCERAVMVNLLGYEGIAATYQERLEKLAAYDHAHLHWYGKTVLRPGRKLGHVTVTLTADSPELTAATVMQDFEALWYGS